MNVEALVIDHYVEFEWRSGGAGIPHTTIILGKRVRFYDSPQPGPDWPWVAFADAIALMEFPTSFSTDIADRWQRIWPNMQRELLDGTVIVPDFVVTGMFRFYADHGVSVADHAAQGYTAAAVNLFARLHAHLSGPEWVSAVQLVGLRNMPTEGVAYAN